ncbi:MAG: hypothetical protein AB1668_06060 [Nanoarchaeota archaeon]
MILDYELPNIERLVEAAKQLPKQLHLPQEFKKRWGRVPIAKTLIDKGGEKTRSVRHVHGCDLGVPNMREDPFYIPSRPYVVWHDFVEDFGLTSKSWYLRGLTENEVRLLLGNSFPKENDPWLVQAILYATTYSSRFSEKSHAFVVDKVHRPWSNDKRVHSIKVDYYRLRKSDYNKIVQKEENRREGLIKIVEEEQKVELSYFSWLKEHEEFMDAVRELHLSLGSQFSGQYCGRLSLELAVKKSSGTSLQELRIGLDKLLAFFVARGAEEVALRVMEKFDYPREEREKMAREAYRSLENHITDSDFGLALFGYCAEDSAHHQLYMARVAKEYLTPELAQKHAREAIEALNRSNSMAYHRESTMKSVEAIKAEFGLSE